MREENQWRRGNNTTKTVTVIKPVETQAQECMYIQGDDKDVIRCFLRVTSKNMQKNARWEEPLCRNALNTFEQYIFFALF